jgi:hypothetical protein
MVALLLAAPLGTAQLTLPLAPVATDASGVEGEAEHLLTDADTIVASWVAYVEDHDDCDPSDLGIIQTDGVDENGDAKACDAPDGLAGIDFDRRVPVGTGEGEQARGTLVFVQEGIDDTDVLALPTAASDANWRFDFDLFLGLDQVPDVTFGAMDFDVVTLAGDSLLDPDSAAYDPPSAPPQELPEPAPGNEYTTRAANDDYIIDPTTYQVVGPPDHSNPPTELYVQLEDGRWVTLPVVESPSMAKKYEGPAIGGCAITRIVMEVPIGYAKDHSPHVGRGPAAGSCSASLPDPVKDPTSASFTLPPWLAGETLALILFVAEHTPETVAGSAEDAADSLLADVMGLFEPQPASCDRDICSGLIGGSGKPLPTQYVTDLVKNGPAAPTL